MICLNVVCSCKSLPSLLLLIGQTSVLTDVIMMSYYCYYDVLFQIIAFIIAMTGVIMILYLEDGFVSSDIWGGILTMISTAGSAVYQVYIFIFTALLEIPPFKKVFSLWGFVGGVFSFTSN